MKNQALVQRRTLIRTTAIGATATLLGAATTGCQGGATIDRQLKLGTLPDAEAELDRLAKAAALDSAATWNWAQTLDHCAQSIEFSMTGFPQPRSALFQRTAGSAAFAVFAWRGRMTHDLAEPIPGAPALSATADPAQALQRLRAVMRAFQAWGGPLMPHFAYGALDKRAYAQAHAMHIANHLSGFQPKG